MGKQIVVSQKGTRMGGMIERVYQEIQKYTDLEIIRKTIYEKSRESHESNYWLGGLLSKVFNEGAYKAWGFADWKEYVVTEVGISQRTAQYFMSIYHWSAELSSDQRTRVEGMPWSRIRELPKVCDSTNADEWLDIAETSSREELSKSIKAAKAGKQTVKQYEDERSQIKKFSLFPAQWQNVEDALERARSMAESDKEGHLLDLICTQFLVETVFANAPGKQIVSQYYGKLEKVLGTKTVVVDAYSGDVLRGKDYLNQIVYECNQIADESNQPNDDSAE